MIGQTLHRKLKIEQHKPTKMHGMILCVPEVSKRPEEKLQKNKKTNKQSLTKDNINPQDWATQTTLVAVVNSGAPEKH